MIRIRHVPDALHRQLKSRAALAGTTLSEYLLDELRQLAERPTLDEWRARLDRRARVKPVATARGCGPRRTRRAVIVVDASAPLESLLRTPAAESRSTLIFRWKSASNAASVP
jgi:hypothetical protein